MWCLKKNIHLTAQHLPGVEYVIADAESQSIRHRSDWQLDPAIFRQIAHWFGPIDVDLFATSLPNTVPSFSWRPDPCSAATNAFLQDWSHFQGYANPPWNLMGGPYPRY